MEKKFTRAMVCKEFKSTCGKCPLHSSNNPKSLPCWLLDESDIQNIMEDYPYADVKVRIIFNDIETRLTEVEKKVSNNVSVEFKPERVVFGCSYNRNIGFSAEVVDKKLYDKLEAKHEADCRLISEYDIEIKKLEDEISTLNKQIDSFGLTCRLYEKETKDLKTDVERWVKRYEHLRDMDKKRLFDLKNAEEERDHYKRLYSFKCDDYNKLLKENSRLSESNDTATKENLELEGENDALSTRNAFLEDKIEAKKTRIANLESKLRNQRANLTSLQEKYEDAVKMNKAREEVYYANIKLQKTIEAKDREIDLLRAELDKFMSNEDNDYDDRWID